VQLLRGWVILNSPRQSFLGSIVFIVSSSSTSFRMLDLDDAHGLLFLLAVERVEQLLPLVSVEGAVKEEVALCFYFSAAAQLCRGAHAWADRLPTLR